MAESESREVWTPLKVIQWAVPYLAQKGFPHPRLDVEVLVAAALGIDRLKVYLQFDRPLNREELALMRGFLKRRAGWEPLQYIVGRKEFFGLSFKVGPGVLIPRPETEQLVEEAVRYLKTLPEEERLVLDLGTGSGCIAVATAKSVPCRVWAVDTSEKALEIAGENARDLGVEASVRFRKGDWFSALEASDPPQFKVILSNPPYLSTAERGELSPEVSDHEPAEALFAGEDGMEAYRCLAEGVGRRLSPGGVLLMELHANRSDNVSSVFGPLNWEQTLLRDLQGFPRVLRLENKEQVDTAGGTSV